MTDGPADGAERGLASEGPSEAPAFVTDQRKVSRKNARLRVPNIPLDNWSGRIVLIRPITAVVAGLRACYTGVLACDVTVTYS